MDWTKTFKHTRHRVIASIMSVLLMGAITSCAVSYKFNGSSINYEKVKSIQIAEFPIRASYVYAPLGVRFNEELKDIYDRQTRLQLINAGGDLQLSGEITGYNQYNQAVSADGYSSEVKLQITIHVNFVNNTNHDEDFDKNYTAFRTYPATSLLTDVQDDLIEEMIKEIIDQIFNDTVANW